MTRRHFSRLVLLPLVIALGPMCALGAAPAPAPANAAGAPAAGGLTMDQAVKMAEKRFHARVVKAETQKDAGHSTYVLRLLDDTGHVRTVHVDAATGAVK